MTTRQPLYTTREAAAYLGVHVTRVRQLAATGIGTRVGRDWVFTAADLAAMAARRTAVGRPRAGAREG